MQQILSNPVAFVTALLLLIGTPWGWLWKQYGTLRTRVEECERERAVLSERLVATNNALAVERGRVDSLTDLLRKEIKLA